MSPSASRRHSSARRSAGVIVEGASGLGRTDGTGIEHHDRSVPDNACVRDLGTGTILAPAGKGEPLALHYREGLRGQTFPLCSIYPQSIHEAAHVASDARSVRNGVMRRRWPMCRP